MSDAKIKGKHKDLSLSQTLKIVKLSTENIMSQIELSWPFTCSKISIRKEAGLSE